MKIFEDKTDTKIQLKPDDEIIKKL